MRKNQTILVLSIMLGLVVVRLASAMGTPPFDNVLRSSFDQETRSAIASAGCLSATDSIAVTSTYRRNRSRRPIPNRTITVTLAFPGRDTKGESTSITISLSAATGESGVASSTITAAEAVARVKTEMETNANYRGVRRIRGPIRVSFTSSDTLQNSVRYAPVDGLKFSLCS